MPAEVTYPHIKKVEGAPARLERLPRIRVSQIVIDHIHRGLLPGEICNHYPHLSQGEAYSALAYYFDHQAEIDAEIEEEQRLIDESYRNAKPSPVEQRLRAQGLIPPK